MEISVFGNPERMLLAARFDNLGKGASGAAIQNMNIGRWGWTKDPEERPDGSKASDDGKEMLKVRIFPMGPRIMTRFMPCG